MKSRPSVRPLVLPVLCAALAGSALAPLRARADDADFFDRHAPSGEELRPRLGLSDEQVKRYDAAAKAKDEALAPLAARIRAGLKKLRAQLADRSSDAEVERTLADVASARRAQRDAEVKYEASLAGFLTARQRAGLLVGTPEPEPALRTAAGGYDPRATFGGVGGDGD